MESPLFRPENFRPRARKVWGGIYFKPPGFPRGPKPRVKGPLFQGGIGLGSVKGLPVQMQSPIPEIPVDLSTQKSFEGGIWF